LTYSTEQHISCSFGLFISNGSSDTSNYQLKCRSQTLVLSTRCYETSTRELHWL